MHAPPKSDLPIISADKLKQYDAFLFGIPTRYGNQIAQVREFWDSTGSLWQSGALVRLGPSSYARGTRPLTDTLTVGQVRRPLRVDRNAGRRAGDHGLEHDVHLCPSRHHLRSSRLQDRLRPNGRQQRDSWWQRVGRRNPCGKKSCTTLRYKP